ncbi:hypothetical protein GR925_38085 [Streptomyces sp. HUCO-GS316]|uniref:hypothetical protein n=1 Tax=Streptomyces sp. HUCO-GS316 TaxID=2692198 RepID=UPI00137096E0|nr:hypothetical protein [Streptomyces sp. HUCO-GS316]MXM69052.1 hypothetical protein [Streptomyces sp. HUCO-GS316]
MASGFGQQNGHDYPSVTEGLRNLLSPVRGSTPVSGVPPLRSRSSVPFRRTGGPPFLTWPAALPVAAARVMRAAAGRRALQVALLVGGLFALGFLCGEQAHAADGVPSVSSTSSAAAAASTDDARSLARSSVNPVGRLVTTPSERTRHEPAPPAEAPALDPTPPAEPAEPDQAVHDPAATAIPEVHFPVNHVVQPVRDVAETLTGESAKTPSNGPRLPTLPSLPTVPILPGTSELPAVPGLPGLPTLPGQSLPAPVTVPQPASAAPPVSSSAGGHEAEGGAHGPHSVMRATGATGATAIFALSHADRHRIASIGSRAPAQQAPTGDPDGALGGKPATDGGTSRHGDAYAVTLNRRPPLRLAAGAAAGVEASEIQDRHRDIPVSPA